MAAAGADGRPEEQNPYLTAAATHSEDGVLMTVEGASSINRLQMRRSTSASRRPYIDPDVLLWK